jgi:hypothetical protein
MEFYTAIDVIIVNVFEWFIAWVRNFTYCIYDIQYILRQNTLQYISSEKNVIAMVFFDC